MAFRRTNVSESRMAAHYVKESRKNRRKKPELLTLG